MRKASPEDVLNRSNRRIGEFLRALSYGHGTEGLKDADLTRITVRMPTRDQPEAMLIVKASDEDGKHIAFVGGLNLAEAVLVWRAKDGAGGLRWREDVPWEQRGG